jgi:predicted DNA-binding transcriptional regulator YafY
MRRADRLFDIIQILRVAKSPTTAAQLAEDLEVTVRTVYRDISTLQASRVPIEGAAGIGYVLRKGFDLPPLMFNADEIDAIAIGARLLRRLRDPGLRDAAESVLAKVASVLPGAPRRDIITAPFFVSDGEAAIPEGVDLADVRLAIRESRKLHITYADASGARSERTIWPIAMVYYVDLTVVAAWCELRQDFRHFRVERIVSSALLETGFSTDGGTLVNRWLAQRGNERAVANLA